uniref:Sulfatase domain-containing protein n=1 Tax=Parastrongyloides trichosuri TaxID=131310 RepID=A0A0N4Z0P0_PARTI
MLYLPEDYEKYSVCEKVETMKKDYVKQNCHFDECEPFSEGHLKWMNPSEKYEKCEPVNSNFYYTLKDGILSMNKDISKEVTCKYKCHFARGVHNIYEGPEVTLNGSIVVPCDVFYISCINNKNILVYENVELHIRKIDKLQKGGMEFLNKNFKIPDNMKKYDLSVIVVDSLSRYHALRSFTKTRKVLLNQGGVEMKFLNVIGDNSRPNAAGFLLNKQEVNVTSIYNKSSNMPNDWGFKNPCNTPLDNKTYIYDYFKKMGYATLYGDDWENDTFSWPDCVSFNETNQIHDTLPFQRLHRNGGKLSTLIGERLKEKCFFDSQHLQFHLEQFIQRYEKQPKASLVWHSNLIHENLDKSFAFDETFEKYFLKMEKYYENSFVILASDHGFRREYLNTDSGQYEHKNPYFLIKPPLDLQNNEELMKNLNDNSGKHISQMDVYATFIDILIGGAVTNFSYSKPYNFSNVINDKIKGLSLLRPLPDENRSCFDMYIPHELCLCKPVYVFLEEEYYPSEYKELKKEFIKALNKKLEIDNLKSKCADIYHRKGERFIVRKAVLNDTSLYEVEATTRPGKAMFKAYFDKNFKVINEQIYRTNNYGKQAEICEEKSNNRMYCYCKSIVLLDIFIL